MYKIFLRPLLFLLPPEKVHHLVVSAIKIVSILPFALLIISFFYRKSKYNNAVKVFGLTFPNRVGLAAGFDKNARIFKQFKAFGFGFIEIGTVTPRPQPGNPRPRSFRLRKDKALINRMGINNDGADAIALRLKNRPANLIIGGNIGKNTDTPNSKAVDDYVYCFEKLYEYVDYFVVNVSCPNVSDMKELQDQEMLEGILSSLSGLRSSKSIYKPILLKISPDLNNMQIDETLKIVDQTGIDGIVATNTTVTRNNLKSPESKIKRIGKGGLSGKPIASRSTEVIRYIHEKTGGHLPVIGVGGIMSSYDALEKLNKGATLIQVYTGFIYEGPGFVKRILRRISRSPF